jgi:hypothetical protein
MAVTISAAEGELESGMAEPYKSRGSGVGKDC